MDGIISINLAFFVYVCSDIVQMFVQYSGDQEGGRCSFSPSVRLENETM